MSFNEEQNYNKYDQSLGPYKYTMDSIGSTPQPNNTNDQTRQTYQNNNFDRYDQSVRPYNYTTDSVSTTSQPTDTEDKTRKTYQTNLTRLNQEPGINEYKQSEEPYNSITDLIRNKQQYNLTETGINSSVGLHTPQEVINVSSYLSDRGNILTKELTPEVKEILSQKNKQINTNTTSTKIKENIDYEQFLSPLSTRGKGKEKDLSDVDWRAGFSGESSNVPVYPQDLTHIINRNVLERGGLDSNQLIKSTWNYATVSNPDGPKDENNDIQKATNLKIAGLQSYPTWAPFGLRENKTWENYTPIDVVSTGKSSAQYDNHSKKFNLDAQFTNGGCNEISKVDQSYCEN